MVVSKLYEQSSEGRGYSKALMDLSLPRFARLGDGVLPKTKLWPITEMPPSSPVSARDGNRTCTPSPCYQLGDISSASLIGDTSINDYKLTMSIETSHSITPVGSIVFSSDEDVPLSSGQEDKRKVRRREPRSRNTYQSQGSGRSISQYINRRHGTGRSTDR